MKKQVYAYVHTHWDMEWYRDKEDFDIRLVDVVDGVINELENNNLPFFYFDGQIIALLNYLKIKPENEKVILKLIKEKKLAIGPFYVSADTYLTSFISMLKNIEIGKKYSKTFGENDFIGYICDVFGISNSIFEALKLSNINKAVIWRGVNPKKIKNCCNFIKNNINTLWLVQGYFNDFLNTENIDSEKLNKYLDKISKYSPDPLIMPIGADHLGVIKNAKEKIKKINKELKNYEIILSSPFEYFKKSKFINTTKEKEFLDNSDTYILGGVYSSRIYQKVKNSILQNRISRITEPLNFYLKEKYDANINVAYETLIKNHAHDGICGCSLDSVARAVDFRFEKCENILNSVERNILQNFKNKNSKLPTSKNSLGLFNLSNFDNIKTIEIKLPYVLENAQVLDYEERFNDEDLANIYKIPVTEEITKIYRQLIEVSNNKKHSFSEVKIIKPHKKVFVSNNSIENEFIKLKVKNKKIFVQNKKNNEQVELYLTDIKDLGDSYNFAPIGEYEKIELIKSNILYSGEIRSSLRLYFKDIKLDVSLDNNSEFLDFNAEINNKKKNHKLQFVIKTNKNISKTIAQDALGVIERKINYNYKMQDYMPAKKPIELKTNSYPMQNFVVANNVSLLTKGLNEYEIYKNEIRLCLLRAFGTISNPKNPARYIPAGPNLKTPEAQMIGKYNVQFALMFGNYKKILINLDVFFANYIAIDGQYDKIIRFINIQNNELFYGISNRKKVIYNTGSGEIQMI